MRTLGPLAATYSIVAFDPSTGELGVAVQSHYFAVGSLVPWVGAGIGAIATQSFVRPAYGSRGLARLAQGAAPKDCLAELVAEDPQAAMRQVAMVDHSGRTAVHTGEGCIGHAGHFCGDGFVTSGNMLRSDEVWGAMAEVFASGNQDLRTRLLLALNAGEAAGGDARGRRSASLEIQAPHHANGETAILDLRVDDHPEPLTELARLVAARHAYELSEDAMIKFSEGDLVGAIRTMEAASTEDPENPEFLFWAGIFCVWNGSIEAAITWLGGAFERDSGWRTLFGQLPSVGLLPDDPALLDRLQGRA